MLTMKALRIEKGISQKDIADYIGVTQPMVSYLENGETPCPDEHKETLAQYFRLVGYRIDRPEDLFIPYPEYLRRL